jgi:hypothetical protein
MNILHKYWNIATVIPNTHCARLLWENLQKSTGYGTSSERNEYMYSISVVSVLWFSSEHEMRNAFSLYSYTIHRKYHFDLLITMSLGVSSVQSCFIFCFHASSK